MSKSLLTAEQVDNSIVKTDNLDALGFLNKSSLAETLKAGVGQQIDNAPITLAVFHCDNTEEAIIDSIHNITLAEYIDDAYMGPNYVSIDDGKFSKAIQGTWLLDHNCLTHYIKDEVTQEYVEASTYLNADGNYSVDSWFKTVSDGGYSNESILFNLGCGIEGEYEPYNYVYDGTAAVFVRYDKNFYNEETGMSEPAITLTFTDMQYNQDLATFVIDSTMGFNPLDDEWFHFALQKTGTIFNLWVNGKFLFSVDFNDITYGMEYIFGSGFNNFGSQGVCVDELRITQDNPYPVGSWQETTDPYSGESYHTYVVDDFTVPTAPYADNAGGMVFSNTGVKNVNTGTELKIWTGTSAEYALVDPKDPHTLYIQTTSEE